MFLPSSCRQKVRQGATNEVWKRWLDKSRPFSYQPREDLLPVGIFLYQFLTEVLDEINRFIDRLSDLRIGFALSEYGVEDVTSPIIHADQNVINTLSPENKRLF
jgi:hypothetical protein